MKHKLKRPIALLLTVVMLLGLLPTAAFAAGDGVVFTTLMLTGFNEAIDNMTLQSKDIDLLEVAEDTQLKWHLGRDGKKYPALMSVNASYGDDVGDGNTRTLTIELAKGLEFASYPKENLQGGAMLESEPTPDETILEQYGYSSKYGKLVYEIPTTGTATGFMLDNIGIQPTRAFFNEDENGMLIQDALKVTLSVTNGEGEQVASETKSYDVELWGKATPNFVVLNSNRHDFTMAPGETVENSTQPYTKDNAIAGQLVKTATYTIRADEELIFSNASAGEREGTKTAMITETPDSEGKKTVTFQSSGLLWGDNVAQSGNEFICHGLKFFYEVGVAADTPAGTYGYDIVRAAFELESGVTVTIPSTTHVTFTVQEKVEGGDDSSFQVNDIEISRANVAQANLTMGGMAWGNPSVNPTRPKTVEIQFDENVVIEAVALPQNEGITNDTVTAVLRMADGTTRIAEKSRSDFKDPTLITLSEFCVDGAVAFQSLTADVGQFSANTNLNVSEWGVRSYTYARPEHLTAIGHFAAADTKTVKTTYTVWTTGFDKGTAGSNTLTSVCTTTAAETDKSVFVTMLSGEPKFPENIEPGDTLPMEFTISQDTSSAMGSAPLTQPVLYIQQPKNMVLSQASLKFYDVVGGKETQLNPVSITDVTSKCTVDDGSRIWQVVLPADYILGYYDADLIQHKLHVQYSLTVLSNAASATLNRSTMFFLTNLEGIQPLTSSTSGVPDVYNILGRDADAKLNGLPTKICLLNGNNQISAGSGIKVGTDEDGAYFNYVEGDDNTIASFAAGQTGSIQLKIVNNGDSTATGTVFYIPIPKSTSEYSPAFGGEDAGTLDLLLTQHKEEYYESSGSSTPTITYATVSKYGKEGIPDDNTAWSATYSDQHDMIRVEYKDGIPARSGEQILTFYIKTADGAENNGKTSIFYPVINCLYGGTSLRQPQAPIAVQCWNGKVSGTVFEDTDRDGVMDAGEAGAPGITVEVATKNSAAKTVVTDQDGKYEVTGIRTDGDVTVTIRDTTHSFNSATGGDARQYSQIADDPGDGSAYSVVTPVEGAPQNATYTYSGSANAVVSAGLVKPYHVEFTTNHEGAMISATEVYRFGNETVGGSNLATLMVTAPTGYSFSGEWIKYVGDTKVDDSMTTAEVLADTAFTADTRYEAQIDTEGYDLTFYTWTPDSGYKETGELKVVYGKTIDQDDADNKATLEKIRDVAMQSAVPGYDFKGWQVNGSVGDPVSLLSILTKNDFRADMNYFAYYTRKNNITVTLDPNYENEPAEERKNQTFEAVVDTSGFTRPGYTLLGWCTAPMVDEEHPLLDVILCPAEDTTYYAIWEAGTVRVTLMPNGGQWTSGSDFANGWLDGTVDQTINLPTEDDLTNPGYTLRGWVSQDKPNETPMTGTYTIPAGNAVLVAVWEATQETITFDYGEDSGITPQTVEVEGAHGSAVGADEAQKLRDVNRNGYSLTGWRADNGTVIPVANTENITINDGDTYFAIWAQGQSKLTFDPGEDASYTAKTFYGKTGTTMTPDQMPADPIKPGYEFAGWYTEEGDKVEEFTFPGTSDAETIYYAQWKAATYTVTFRYNGGKDADGVTSKQVNVTYPNKVTDVPTPTYTADPNAKLLGWTDVNTGEIFTPDEIKDRAVTANVVYSANWDVPSYTVTFGNLGNDATQSTSYQVPSGSTIPGVPAPQTPEQMTFLGWVKDGDISKYYKEADFLTMKVTSDMSFQAAFSKEQYTITFTTANGTLSHTSASVAGGSSLSAVDFPDITGTELILAGWMLAGTDETKTEKEWQSSGMTVDGPMSFFAVFQGQVTLSLVLDGGTIDGPIQFTGPADKIITIPDPVKVGHTFAGWYDAPEGGNKIESPYKLPSKNAVWYAHWTANTLTAEQSGKLTYNGQGQGQEASFTIQQDGAAVTNPTLTVTYTPAPGDANAKLDDNGKPMNAGLYIASIKVSSGGTDLGSTTAQVKIDPAAITGAVLESGNWSYTGTAHTPEVESLTVGDQIYASVEKDKDYTVSYANNINAGQATATVNGMGNFTGKFNVEFTITPYTGTLTVTQTNALTYNGQGQEAAFTVTDGNGNAVTGFTVTYAAITGELMGDKPCGAGSYTATISGGAGTNWAGAKVTATVEVAKYGSENPGEVLIASNSNISFAVGTEESVFTKGLTVKDIHGNTLTADDYTITYLATTGIRADGFPAASGVYTAVITGTGENYDGTNAKAELSFVVTDTDLEIVLSKNSETFKNEAFTEDELKDLITYIGGKEPDWSTYTLTIPGGEVKNVGTYALVVTANNGTGTGVAMFTITPKVLAEDDVTLTGADSFTYDGSAKTPGVTVTVDGAALTMGIDYTVTYADNVNAGTDTAKVTVTGAGNYSGSITKTFSIAARSLGNGESYAEDIKVSVQDQTWTGSALTPTVNVTDGGKTLTQNTDFTVEYSNNINVGPATVTITGKGDYTGAITAKFNISETKSLNASVTGDASWTYDGTTHITGLNVTFDSVALTPGAENGYAVSIKKDGQDFGGSVTNIKDAGRYEITVTGTGSYANSPAVTLTVTVDKATVTITPNADQSKTYGQNDPSLTYTASGIVAGDDATMTGALGRESGENAKMYSYTLGTLALTGEKSGNYTLALAADASQFTITAKSLTGGMVSGIEDSYTYNNTQIRPVPTVEDSGNQIAAANKTLTLNVDYTLAYGNNNTVGNDAGSVTITGAGNYTGTVTVTFDITTGEGNLIPTLNPKQNTYTGKEQKPGVSVTLNTNALTEQNSANSDDDGFYVDWGTGSYTDAGTYTVTVKGTGQYKALEAQATYTITAYTGTLTVTLVETSGSYGTKGTDIKVSKVVDSYGNELSEGEYTITIDGEAPTDEVLDRGGHTVTVTGTGENHKGASGFTTFGVGTTAIDTATVTVTGSTKVYTGSAQEAAVTVTMGGKTLEAGKDYTVSYSDSPVDVGTYDVIITGMGDYSGTVTKQGAFTITAKTLTEDMVSGIPERTAYTGQEVTLPIVVKYNSMTLSVGTDYTVTYENNTEVSTLDNPAKVTITAVDGGNFSGSIVKTFMIESASGVLGASLSTYTAVYDGTAKKTTVSVTFGGVELTLDKDYTLSADKGTLNGNTLSATEVGEYAITVTGIGNYAGTNSVERVFTIVEASMEDGLSISVDNATWTYAPDGKAVTVTVKGVGNAELSDADYGLTYVYTDMAGAESASQTFTNGMTFTEAGMYVITATGKGNYKGSTGSATVVISRADLKDAVISGLESLNESYTGKAHEPDVTVSLDGYPVSADDYTVSYGDNVNAGQATVTVIASADSNNYIGSTSETFTIQPLTIDETNLTVTGVEQSYPYTGSEIKPSPTVQYGDLTLVLGRDYYLKYSDNINVGDAAVTIVGRGNYEGEVKIYFSITSKSADSLTVNLIPSQQYTGEEIEPGVVIEDGSMTLREDRDYEVSYTDNIDVGSAIVTITFQGNYEGIRETSFTITPAAIEFRVDVDPVETVYTGEEIAPTITVTDPRNSDMDVSDYYEFEGVISATDVGVYKFTVTGTGNYEGSTGSGVWAITPQLEEDGFTLDTDLTGYTFVYDGGSHAPTVITVTDSEGGEVSEDNYNLTYTYDGKNQGEFILGETEFVDVGVYMISATGSGNVIGSGSTLVIITPADLSGFDVEYEDIWEYTGSEIEPDVTVYDEDGGVVDEDDYTVVYANNVNSGTASIAITGNRNYTGTIVLQFEIIPMTVTVIPDAGQSKTFGEADPDAYTYTTDPGTLPNGDSITGSLSRESGEDTGEYAFTLGSLEIESENKANYKLELQSEVFTIHPKAIDGFTLADIPDQTYTGEALKPAISLTDGDTVLTEEDYTLSYQTADGSTTSDTPVDAGTYTVIVTGAGNYSGTLSKPYTIHPKAMTFVVTADPSSAYYDGEDKTPDVIVKDGDRTLASGRDYSVTYIYGKDEAKDFEGSQFIETGSYKLLVTGLGNYAGSTGETTFTITRKPSGGGGGGGGTTRYTITAEAGKGGSISPDGKVRVDHGDDQTFRIKADEGYEIEDVIVDGESVGAVSKYTFKDVRESHTIEVEFIKSADPEIMLPFVDVPRDAYYYDAVYWAVANGITSGTSAATFSPDQSCTRAQMVTFLWRAAGSPAPKNGVNPFTDVQPGAYYYDAVLWAVEQGITSGTSATTFSPNATVSRGQTVTFLWRANGAPVVGGSSFTDVSADAYYATAVAWAVSEGVTSGTGNGMFSPDADCTRAQIVTFMYRAAQR